MEDPTQEKLARSTARPSALTALYENTANAEPVEAPEQPSRQKRRAALRKIDKARAALSEPGESRNQAVLEQKRKMGQVKPPRSVRREANATFNRRK